MILYIEKSFKFNCCFLSIDFCFFKNWFRCDGGRMTSDIEECDITVNSAPTDEVTVIIYRLHSMIHVSNSAENLTYPLIVRLLLFVNLK